MPPFEFKHVPLLAQQHVLLPQQLLPQTVPVVQLFVALQVLVAGFVHVLWAAQQTVPHPTSPVVQAVQTLLTHLELVLQHTPLQHVTVLGQHVEPQATEPVAQHVVPAQSRPVR